MKSVTTLIAASAALSLTAISRADFLQPYDPANPLSSFVSTVQSCNSPIPMPLAAADDFKFADNFLIRHFRWWGTVSDPLQLNRPYYIAIYKDGGCKPGKRVFETCAVAQTAFYAIDCQGLFVYTFNVTLANPLPIPGGHFWFRVAESDAGSVRPGLVDFQWSGRRPVRGCYAGQHSTAGWSSPLLEACDGKPTDLAFCVLG